MSFFHHLVLKNLDHYLTLGTFAHTWFERRKERARAANQKLGQESHLDVQRHPVKNSPTDSPSEKR